MYNRCLRESVVMSRRMEYKIEAILSEDQFGFRKNMGTREAILALRIIIEKRIRKDKPTYIAFVDVEKAFDNKETAVIRFGETEEVARIRKGVRQGCNLSPSIFNAYIQEAIDIIREKIQLGIKINGRKIDMLRFADDIAVIAENEEDLQRMLRYMEETLLNELSTKINTQKTKVLVCSRNNNITTRIHLQNNQEIKQVEEFAYLGSIISKDGRSKKEIVKRICQAKIAFNKKRGLFTSKNIVQCLNCQEYGHSRKYCAYPPRCVRCGEHHPSSSCGKTRDTPATSKCGLCQGAHPANYKGCAIYQTISRKHNNNISSKKAQQPPPHNLNLNINTNPEYQLQQSGSENTPRSPKHKDELLALLQNNRIDIALISETHFINSTHFYLPGFQIFKTNHPDGTAHAGAAIIVKSSLLFFPLPQFQTDHIQASGIQITLNNTPLNIFAVYSPPRHTITLNQFNDFFLTLGHKFIIGGDLNAKNLQWGCRVNNPRGNLLHLTTQNRNYKVHSPPSPTYWPTSPRKRPDILDIFISKIPNSFHSLTTNLNDLYSDHSAILLTIDSAPLAKPKQPSLILGQMDWLKFKSSLDNQCNLKISLKSPNDIDEAVHLLTKSIQEAAWSSSSPMPNTNSSINLPLHIRILISDKRRARATWQRTKYPSDKRKLNNLTNKLKRLLASIRSDNFTKRLVSLSSTDNSLWQTTRKILRTKQSVPPLKKSDGTWAVTDLDKANIFRHHLYSTFQPHNNILTPSQIEKVNLSLSHPLPMTLPPKHIRPSDVEYAIKNSPRHKSPGYDLITAEVATQLPKKTLLLLTHIFNPILRLSYFPVLWKFSIIIMIPKPGKPPDSPESYRPISLLPLFSKIFERIILKRILPIIEANIPNTQFGFRHNHSTIHQVHRLVDKISYTLEKKLICTAAFLDVSQAFDRVWHEGLLFKLKSILPPYYFLLFKSYLENRYFSVRSGFSLSEVSPIHAGVPQGSVTAPLLFNLFTSDQPTTPNTTIGDFADDKALLAIHSDPEIASNLVQNHLNLLSTWYKDWGIKINETKSIHYTFTLRQIVCPPIFLNNVPLPTAQNVRYLGLHLDRRLTWATHTHNKRLALNNRSRQLRYLLTSQHLNLKNKLLLYKLLLKPIWTYGIQLWGAAKKSNLNKIQIFQSKCLRQITKAPYFVSNHTLHKDLAIPTVQNVAKTFYKRTHSKFHSHRNPLITELSTNTIPGDPRRRLKRTWCRDLLI
ncbi:Endonuclease/exonuclease/phosphatase,Reverse transcriptase domain [Cinara cedri]|uniref:Endonuclease/exonuclease/phosphatase,Reverse transcriptase domain n=1 Tax=Cinara cedri TaxID=506608 RepID=A0A5E4MVI6_9HEMI|nr:Endonuclease/exonuclease/phosphatase,Reverse transcriptase domain [Cinara cedri]